MQAENIDNIQAKVLEATYRTNMECFRTYMPELYEYLVGFKPKHNLLAVDPYGQYNFYTGQDWVYPKDMNTDIKAQVDLFIREPQRFLFKGIRANQGENHHFFHTYFLEKMSKVLDALPPKSLVQKPTFVPVMVLVGVGIGYHIEMLDQHYDIQILNIYEPNPDVFYASLFVVDYASLITRYTEESKNINIQIGKSWTHFINGLSEQIKLKGYFYGSQVYLYCHYRSEAIKLARAKVYQFIHRIYLGLGFYEDEVISINHTLMNLKEKARLIKKGSIEKCFDASTPVFIVGNGPSLDQTLPLIKKYQDKAIVVSCSSSLGVLLKNNITPDFHVETERGTNVYRCLMILDDVEKIKSVPLFCLNTVYPKVASLFKDAVVAMKTNDVATNLLREVMPDDFNILSCCNPTSGNGAVSVAANLGFKQMYLFGLDLAVIDEAQHHSKDSFYFEEEHADKNTNLLLNLEAEGNFRDKVKTSYEWDMAKYSVERLILELDLNCFNTSDGVRIAGAKPLPVTDFPELSSSLDKQKIMQHINTQQVVDVSQENIDDYEKSWRREYLKIETIMGGVMDTLRIIPNNKRELFELMKVQKDMIYREEDNQLVLYNMFWSSLSHLHLGLCSVLLNIEDDDDFRHQASICFDCVKQYLKSCLVVTRESYGKSFAEFDLNTFLDQMGEVLEVKNVT